MKYQAPGTRHRQRPETSSVHRSPFTVHSRAERGVTTLLVIGFLGVFTLIMGALVGYVLEQAKYGRALHAREEALSIAESGLEYFKWHVARNTAMRENGTGLPYSSTYTVNDPEGDEIGTAAITATAEKQCGRVQWIDVESEGTSNADTRFKRTLVARYMRPSVAEYAFVMNGGAYYTSTVVGPVHSNNGIRMDGSNNSTVSSKLGAGQFWCDGSYNCSPSQWKDGVFGSGSGSALWQFPVNELNFTTMFAGTDNLQGYATADGLYLSGTASYLNGVQQGSSYPSVSANNQRGYHLVFLNDGRVRIYRVTGTYPVSAREYNAQTGSLGTTFTDYPDISGETEVSGSPFTLPSDCKLVYSRAKTWVSGTVNGKITVVAADSGSYSPDIMFGGTIVVSEGNIGYATTDGTTGLTAIAERAIRSAYRTPNDMSIRGTFVAQNNFYGRYYYGSGSYRYRNSLTVNGTLVSFLRPATWYGSSGFQNRYTAYDRLQAFTPPPFTPSARTDYGYVLWREE